jgi:hypothetical protein
MWVQRWPPADKHHSHVGCGHIGAKFGIVPRLFAKPPVVGERGFQQLLAQGLQAGRVQQGDLADPREPIIHCLTRLAEILLGFDGLILGTPFLCLGLAPLPGAHRRAGDQEGRKSSYRRQQLTILPGKLPQLVAGRGQASTASSARYRCRSRANSLAVS